MHKGLLIAGILLLIASLGLIVTSVIFHQWITLTTGVLVSATMLINLTTMRKDR